MEKEYPISLGMKTFYGVLAVVMFGFSIYLFNIYNPARVAPAVLLFPILIIFGSVCLFINIFKRKIIIYDDRIVSIGLFSTKEIFIESIRGVRIGPKIIYIQPLNVGDSQLRIANYIDLKNNSELCKWLSGNFKDLDSIDLTNERNKILQDPELGVTEAERKEKLKNLKRLALFYNIIGVAIGISILIFHNTITAVALSILYPLIGIVIILNSKGLIKFFSNPKINIYPNVVGGFLFPSLLTLLFSLDNYTIYKSNNLWLPALTIATFSFTLLYKKGTNKFIQMKSQIIMIVIFALIYGFASTLQINCALDNSPAQIYKAAVLDHRISHGRHTSYFLTLSTWGPREAEKEVEVRGHIYRSADIGDSVSVVFRQGLLDIPWFIVTKE